MMLKNKPNVARNGLLKVRNRFLKGRDPQVVVSEARVELNPALYGALIGWLRSQKLLKYRTFDVEFPPRLGDLKSTRALDAVSFERELRWAAAYLLPYAGKLAKFVELSQTFQRAILQDDFSLADLTLCEVEANFGQSLWLIKNRIAFLQLARGLEAQKNYARVVRDETLKNGFPAYIAYFVSMRNEATVTPSRFHAQFLRQPGLADLPKDIVDYLRYHIVPDYNFEIREVSNILRNEAAGSVVDYYESFVSACRAIINCGPNAPTGIARKAAVPIQRLTRDLRFGMILFAMGATEALLPEPAAAIMDAAEHLLTGDFKNARTLAREQLLTKPDSWAFMEIVALATALESSSGDLIELPLVNRLTSRMVSVILNNDTASEDVRELIKFSVNFYGSTCAAGLWSFISREMSHNPLPTSTALSTVGLPELSPLRVVALPSEVSSIAYAMLLRHAYGERVGVAYALRYAGHNTQPPEQRPLQWEEESLLEAELCLRQGNHERALQLATKLDSSDKAYYQQRAIRINAHCLLRLNRLAEAIRAVTSAYVRNRKLQRILPIANTVRSLSPVHDLLRADVSLSILYDMYARDIGPEYEAQKNYAYEDFLFAHGLSRPSELRDHCSHIEKQKLIYFLRYVCVESVMDSSTAFNSSREITEERLAVCRLLAELDQHEIEVYHTEIKELLRRLMVQKRLREVEQSKIYVDTESIIKTVRSTLSESFSRYVSFIKQATLLSDMGDVGSGFTRVKLTGARGEQLTQLTVPKNEVAELFESIVVQLRDEFVSSTEHGLDGYLSVRIRHGTLSGQLRRPLEDAKLVTQRDRTTGDYRTNEHWSLRIGAVDDFSRNLVTARLAAFARQFDDLVQVIIKEWIQVKKDRSGKGMFDFSLRNLHAIILAQKVTTATTFEEFVDAGFQLFGEMLDENLELVRRKIQREAKPAVGEMLTALQSDLEKLGDRIDSRDIINEISMARTAMQVTFDRIVNWFRRARSVVDEPFSIDDAIDISVGTVRTISSNFDAVVTSTFPTQIRFKSNLLSFIDIFFIIFENIVRHAESATAPIAHVTIDYRGGDSCRFLVENEVADGVASAPARARIATIKSTMDAARHMDSVSIEGGTGFHKIGKILSHDLGGSRNLDFGFRSDDKFFVEFLLPARVAAGIEA